jgi:hypothetical protein
LAAVDVMGQAVIICEWTSRFKGQGFTETALKWFRSSGYTIIAAQGVGMIEDGVADESTQYWQHLQAKGLVDVLINDMGEELAPVDPSAALKPVGPESSPRIIPLKCFHAPSEPGA